jgi:2-oxoglutarate dehydrogenase E1 component
VLLLPHGFEGQGPEHSSARIERFLVLCAGNNMQIANCTTPAQYFHLLRRQMYGGTDRRGVRKPLVVFTPKSLLRHAKAVSTVADLTSGGFREVLPDGAAIDPGQITRVVFCSGKIYYDLLAAREQRQANHVALVRIEQLYPFAERCQRRAAALPAHRGSGLGAGGAAQHGTLALHAGTVAAAACPHRPRVALCGPPRKRQPRHRVGSPPPGGAGRHYR